MSRSYADRKLAEALAEAGGSPGVARRIVLEWAGRDERLLKELVQPFIQGIVGHAVERAGRAAAPRPSAMTQPPRPSVAAQPPRPLAPSVLDGVIRTLGRNFADAAGGAQPGAAAQQGGAAPSGAASARHIAAMHSLAKAHLHKPGR
jgi:hypothetical protein